MAPAGRGFAPPPGGICVSAEQWENHLWDTNDPRLLDKKAVIREAEARLMERLANTVAELRRAREGK
jgi:hypothetical protein